MNYLAHIFLSGKDKGMQLGNFVADAVKGNAYLNYPLAMQKGILLHRQIDSFSDAHPVVREMVDRGRICFGRYSPVVIDVLLDYFLASDFERYAHCSLRRFALAFYWNLMWHYRNLPPRFQHFMWHFILTDRLSCYATKRGIFRSLSIMVKYRGLQIDPQKTIDFLEIHEAEWRVGFKQFFPELEALCQREFVRDATIMLNS